MASEKPKQPAYTTSESDCSENEDPDQNSHETSKELKVNEEEQKDKDAGVKSYEKPSCSKWQQGENAAKENPWYDEDQSDTEEVVIDVNRRGSLSDYEIPEPISELSGPESRVFTLAEISADEDPEENLLEEVEELKLDLQNGDTPKNNV